MKNLKKLVSIVLTLAMLISTVAVSVSAVSYSDVEKSSSYAEAVDILSGLKILQGDEKGNFNPDAEIKRSEFAAVVCRALGQENAANGAKGFTKFADVAVDHWAVGYINWAAQQKIVNGRDAATFDPDAPVKYQEAVKMLVAALGYEPMAAIKGGYPTGYLVVAASNNITTGVSMSGEANAPRKAVAQLTYNALDVPLMDASYITANGQDEYAIYNGKNDSYELRTILNYYLGVAKIKATVNDTHKSLSSLYTKGSEPRVALKVLNIYKDTVDNVSDLIGGDSVAINGTIKPFVGETNADEYLGYTVVAYVGVNDDDEATLYAISPDLKSNDIIEITKDVNTVKVSDDRKTVEYWENIDTDRETTKVDIASDATVYVNGTSVGSVNGDGKADFEAMDESAKIVLMAPKNTDVYDKVFITKYSYAIVDSVIEEDSYIKAKNSSGVDLSTDTYGDTFVYTLTYDGEEITLKDLQENDVLNMAWSGGVDDGSTNKYVDIIVTRKTVEGTVTELKQDNGIDKFGIDGVFYQRATGAKSIQMSDEGVFYLTADDKIIDMQVKSTTSDNYGFITKKDSETKFGENAYSVKLFTKDGTLQVLPVSTSSLKIVTYSGTTKITDTLGASKTLKQGYIFDAQTDATLTTAGVTDAAQRARLLAYNINTMLDKANGANVEKRFVTYKATSGEITEIAFSIPSSSRDVFNRTDLATADYAKSTNRFGGFKIGDTSKLFYVPVAADNSIDEDKIELKSFTSLDEDTTYTDAFVVNVDSDRYLGAAVMTDIGGFGGKNTGLAIVKSRSTGLDTDGNDADKLTLIQGGEEKTYVVNEDVDIANNDFGAVSVNSVTDMSKGDIFLYTLNGKDEISQLYLIYKEFDSDSKYVRKIADALVADNSIGGSTDIKVAFGIVTAVGSDITLGNKRLNATKEKISGFDFRDGSTIALFDENKTSSSSGFITSLRDFGTLKASSETVSDTAKKYLAVVKLDRYDVTDVVEITVGSAITDAEVQALTFVGLN